ncbi:unnamed protein product, partial [Musa textilis]
VSSFREEQTTIGCAVTLPSGPLFFFLSTSPFILYCLEGMLFVCSKSSSFRTESMVNTDE